VEKYQVDTARAKEETQHARGMHKLLTLYGMQRGIAPVIHYLLRE